MMAITIWLCVTQISLRAVKCISSFIAPLGAQLPYCVIDSASLLRQRSRALSSSLSLHHPEVMRSAHHCAINVASSSAHLPTITVARTVSSRCAVGRRAPLSSAEPPSGAFTEPHHLPLFDCCLSFFVSQPTGSLNIVRPMGSLSIL